MSGQSTVPSTWGTASSPSLYLMINLGAEYNNIANIQVDGVGNANLFSAFDVFVSATAPTAANLSSLANAQAWGTLVLTDPDQAENGLPWQAQSNVSMIGTNYQYVVYYALNGNDGATGTGCPTSTTCYPGNAIFSAMVPISGQEDACVTEMLVNTTPEPATMGLLGFGFLAIGFVRRSRKR